MSLLRISTQRLPIVTTRTLIATRSYATKDHVKQPHHKTSPPPPTNDKVEQATVPAEPPHDESTSAYSPTMTLTPEEHIADGIPPAGIVSGAPIDLQTRTVRIYKPAKAATQSSNWPGHQWRMDWDVLGKGHRWENPLMGWQSSGDFVQGTSVKFATKEDAIYFAEKQGYEWFVQEPKEREIKSKAYADNFNWSAKKLKYIHTK